MRVLDAVVAVFVLALVALVWALLAIVHHVRRSRRRTRRLREDESFSSSSLGLGLSTSRIDLISEGPELSFRDPVAPGATGVDQSAPIAAEVVAKAAAASTDDSDQESSNIAPVAVPQAAADSNPEPLPAHPVETHFSDLHIAAKQAAKAALAMSAMSESHGFAPLRSISDETAAAIMTAASAPSSAPDPAAQETKTTDPIAASSEEEGEGEWETSLLRTLSGGDRALLARAKMSEAWEETAMPDFVMPSRASFPAAARAPQRGHITATLFGEPFTFEPLRSRPSLADDLEDQTASSGLKTATTAAIAQTHRTWSPTPRSGSTGQVAAPTASSVSSPLITSTASTHTQAFAPPVLAMWRSAAVEMVEPFVAPEPATEPAAAFVPDLLVPVMARPSEVAASQHEWPNSKEEAIPEPSAVAEPEFFAPPVVSTIPVLARLFAPELPPMAAVQASEALPPGPDQALAPATPAATMVPVQPLVLSRAEFLPVVAAETHVAEVPAFTQDLPAVAATHAGIALPPAPLARPVAAPAVATAAQSASEPSPLAHEAEAGDEAASEAPEPVIAPTFPISQPFDFEVETAKTVPFRVNRPAPPLVRPQPQTFTGAIAALRDAGMDSGASWAAAPSRQSSQSLPLGPAFQRAAPRLASNTAGRHLVAPLRRPDLSSYFSKDLGDLSDPVAPRGRNREPRTADEQKRQA